jgi:hypothetical protein
MRRFLFGAAVGLAVGMVAPAIAQRVVGADGYLSGWDVTFQGRTICNDPFVWVSTREIECD